MKQTGTCERKVLPVLKHNNAHTSYCIPAYILVYIMLFTIFDTYKTSQLNVL